MALMVLRLHSGDIKWIRSGGMRAGSGDHIATVLCGPDTTLHSALRQALQGFGLSSTPLQGERERSSAEMLERLRSFVDEVRLSGSRAFVVLDNPDALSSDVLDDVRGLTSAAASTRQSSPAERSTRPAAAQRPLVPATLRTVFRAWNRMFAGLAIAASLLLLTALLRSTTRVSTNQMPGWQSQLPWNRVHERVLTESPGFLIFVTAADTPTRAGDAIALLSRRRVPAFMEPTSQEKQFRVMVGPYVSADEASGLLAVIMRDFPEATLVGTEPR
jgi:hypothetical protein